MSQEDLNNLYKTSMDVLFLLSRDYLIVWMTIIENERFIITIYVFLFVLGLKDYNMSIQDLSNFYKRSMVSSFSPVIT